MGPSDDLAARLSLILALSSVALPTTVDRGDLALLVATGTVDEEVRSAAIAFNSRSFARAQSPHHRSSAHNVTSSFNCLHDQHVSRGMVLTLFTMN